MHPWAGKGWGFQFIPRVGMEVVIAFEGGDPDRPIVLGTVYNAVQPEPFTLPLGATRSGIRTKSTPNSGGFNELSFEDSASNEQVFLRAERDFDSVVQRDRTAAVDRDDHLSVQGSQYRDVVGNRELQVEGNHRIDVGGSGAETTARDHRVRRGSLTSHVAHDRRDEVDCNWDSVVRGHRHDHTHAWRVDRVDSSWTQLIGHREHGAWNVDVRGESHIHSGGKLNISSHEEIVLRVGDSFIRLAPDCIDIGSPKVTVTGKNSRIRLDDGKCKVFGKTSVQIVSQQGIALRSGQGASLGLASQAKLDGSQVLLNSPTQATDSIQVDTLTETTITLQDQDGHALPHQRYRVTFPDGSVQMGTTDENGEAVVDGEGDAEIEFGDHTDPEQE